MKKFHVNFRPEGEQFLSRGENFEASSPIIALGMFMDKYPSATFLAMYSIEDISRLTSHQIAFEKKFVDSSL